MIEDSGEFEALLSALQFRGIRPEQGHLSGIVGRISRGDLKPSRKALVSLLRWISTGEFAISRDFLERLLRNDSREVRTAAARAVVSLARKRRESASRGMDENNLPKE